MTSDPKLPIPSYRVSMLGPNPGWDLAVYDGISEELCKAADVRELVERMEKAEAQRDRLAEVLRTAVELSHSYDSDNVACWDMVWASADDALADIEKENA